MQHESLDADFRAFRERGDQAALARVFDAAAPRLLLLAAHVARGAAEAEDLVQSTFLEALRDHAQWDGKRPVGVWLASILRHRALDRLRASGRECRAAGDTDLDAFDSRERDPLDILADDEVHARLVAAIEALDEPYRQAVHLRLVHGLAPLEIARALGRSPGTLRMQLSRGLEKLRAALPSADALLGGALTAIVVGESARGLAAVRGEVLTAAAKRTAASGAVLAGAGALSLWKVAGGALLAVALALVVVQLLSSRESTGAQVAASVNSPAAIVVSTPARPEPTELAVAAADTLRRSVDDASGTNTAAAAPVSRATGRVLLPEGAPSTGVARARVSGDAGVLEVSSPFDGDGNYVLEWSLGGAFEAVVDIEPTDFESLRYSIANGAGDAVAHTIGELRLSDGGALRGRVVDTDGEPLRDLRAVRLVMWAKCTSSIGVDLYAPARWLFGVPIDPVTGVFTLSRLPRGHLTVNLEGPGWSTHVSHVHTDADAEIEIVYAGPRPERALRLQFPSRMPIEAVARDAVSLTRDGAVIAAPIELAGSLTFVDLEPLPHNLVVDDPRFVRVERHGLVPGADEIVELVGASRVELVVRNGANARVDAYTIEARFASGTVAADSLPGDLTALRERADDFDVIDGVASCPQFWTIRADGAAPFRLELPSLTRGATTRATVVLASPHSISGRVLDENGAGVAGALVRARPYDDATADPFAPDAPVVTSHPPRVDATTTTAADGSFVLDNGADPVVVVEARVSEWVRAVSVPLEGGATCELRVPASTSLRGRLVGAPNGLAGFGVSVLPVDPQVRSVFGRWRDAVLPTPVAADGSFALSGIPLTSVELCLHLPRSAPDVRGRTHAGTVVGVATLDANEPLAQDVEFDVSAHVPGTVEVLVLAGGSPLRDAMVLLSPFGEHTWLRDAQHAAPTDEDGRAVITNVPSGTWYPRVMQPALSFTVNGALFDVARAGSVEVSVAFDSTTTTLSCAHASGESLAGRRVRIEAVELEGVNGWSTTLTLDESGSAVATLPHGRHRARLEARRDGKVVRGPAVEFTWGAAGSAPASVALSEPD